MKTNIKRVYLWLFKLYEQFREINTIKRSLIYLIVATIGGLLNTRFEYRLFYFHLFSLLIALNISLYASNKIITFFKDLELLFKDSVVIREYKKIEIKLNSSNNLLIPIPFVVVYFRSIYLLEYIEFGLMGTYATAIGVAALSAAIIGFWQFILVLTFIIKLYSIEIKNYNRCIPAGTNWLVIIAENVHKCSVITFVLGFIFTTIYAVLIPKNAFSYQPFALNIEAKFSFLITWGGIILSILILFPTVVYLNRFFIKKLVIKLKNQTIQEYEKKLNDELKKNGTMDVDQVNFYINLIGQVETSRDYPISNSTSPISVLIYMLTVGVHSISILNGLVDVLTKRWALLNSL